MAKKKSDITPGLSASILQANLHAALSLAVRAASSRATLPILENVLLKAEPFRGFLTLQCTNLEIGISVSAGAKITGPGAVTVHAKRLLDIVGNLPKDAQVELQGDEKGLELSIKAPGSKSKMNGIAADEFPLLTQESENVTTFTMSGKILRHILGQVDHAVATDDARPILTCVCLDIKEGGLAHFVAADGFRLAEKTHSIVGTPQVQALIAGKAVAELRHILGTDEEQQVEIAIGPNRISFKTDTALLTSQRMEGTYPPYQQIIPKTHAIETTIPRIELLQACRVAEVFAREAANTLRLNFADGNLTVEATSAETGNANAVVPLKTFTGDPFIIAANVKYLKDALDAIPTPDVWMGFTTAASPMHLKPTSGDGLQMVVMPMHLGQTAPPIKEAEPTTS